MSDAKNVSTGKPKVGARFLEHRSEQHCQQMQPQH